MLREQPGQDAESAAKSRTESHLKAAGVPSRFSQADIEKIVGVRGKAAAMLCKHTLEEEGRIIALLGPTGVGKTFLACALIRKFCQDGQSARYLRSIDVWRSVTDAWNYRLQSEQDLIDELASVDLLVLDNLQVRPSTDTCENRLVDLIDRRYANLKPTLLVGNLRPESLADNLGSLFSSRMMEVGITIACEWESLRRPNMAYSDPFGD